MKFEEILDKVTEGQANALTIAKKALADGKEAVSFTLEQRKLLPEPPREPVRAESNARAHTFFEVKSFAAYLKKYGTEHTVIFGNPEAGVVSAVLDESAEDGRETLSFTPMLSPLWKPWEELVKPDEDGEVRKIGLSEFIDFILNNRRAIVDPDARELIHQLSQIKATTTRELYRGRGANSLNGILIKTSIQGVEKTDVVELPESIKVATPIYVRDAAQIINLDLCIEADSGSGIWVSVSSGDILNAKVKAFETMFEELERLVDENKFTITLGDSNYAAWNYLPEQKETAGGGHGDTVAELQRQISDLRASVQRKSY